MNDKATIIKMAVTAVVFAFAFIGRSIVKRKLGESENPKKSKNQLKVLFCVMLASAWYFIGIVVSHLGAEAEGIKVEFEMFSPRTNILGFSIADSTILCWKIIAIITVLALLFRFLVVPKFQNEPHGIQNVMEFAIEAMDNFTTSVVGHIGKDLSPYMFSVAIFMVGCAASELFGKRPPTSDLLMTGTLGITTFILLNFYGIKEKGIKGRLKSMASPSPIIFPMKILSDIAVPVSLACRLFGNMLGGMIVMELLRSSLGGYSVGISALAGIYFNLFHPLIQTYIFIVLSLTFINEAIE